MEKEAGVSQLQLLFKVVVFVVCGPLWIKLTKRGVHTFIYTNGAQSLRMPAIVVILQVTKVLLESELQMRMRRIGKERDKVGT
jgi:hypothetical protein